MNIITFDIEDWFHILEHEATRSEAEWVRFPTRIHESVNRILGLLSENNVKATFFCLGWIAERYPDVIKLIDDMGHEVASHSYAHQLITSQSFKNAEQDVRKSVEALENICGKKIKAYRAPGFSLTRKTPWFIEILNQNGIEIDCSISPARHAHGGEDSFNGKEPKILDYKGLVIKEFPLNYLDIYGLRLLFSGGGYFRLFPYWLISRLMQRSEYVMTYFHPRDFDAGQPVIEDLSRFRKFKSYYGLSFSYQKLSMLLQDFDFLSLYEADGRINWDTVDTFELA